MKPDPAAPDAGQASAALRLALRLGVLHALVDATSAATALAQASSAGFAEADSWGLILLYNVLAFGLQPLLGMAVDRRRAYRMAGLSGVALTVIAAAAGPWLCSATALLAGVGNALFHVGAGGMVLAPSPGRAAAPGLFVAPGALGLAAGTQLGTAGFPCRGLLAAALGVCGLLLAGKQVAAVPNAPSANGRRWPVHTACGAALLCLAVAVRSWLGDELAAPARGVTAAVMAMALVAVAGKGLGGFLTDRLGWRSMAVVALVVLAAWLRLAPSELLVNAAASVLLLQLTTAVTLSGLQLALPRHPGTVFGLASLALLLGVMPAAAGWPAVAPSWVSSAAALCSALAVFCGLSLLGRQNSQQEDA